MRALQKASVVLRKSQVIFSLAQNPHPHTTTPRGTGEPKEGADLKFIPENAIKIVKEEHCVLFFRLTTPEGAFVCPRQPVVHPFTQDK
jgi:hypothetical protein